MWNRTTTLKGFRTALQVALVLIYCNQMILSAIAIQGIHGMFEEGMSYSSFYKLA